MDVVRKDRRKLTKSFNDLTFCQQQTLTYIWIIIDDIKICSKRKQPRLARQLISFG
jgi:hypothetical protein